MSFLCLILPVTMPDDFLYVFDNILPVLVDFLRVFVNILPAIRA